MILVIILFAITTIGFGLYCFGNGCIATKTYMQEGMNDNKYLYQSGVAVLVGIGIIATSILLIRG